jgi:soluble lytic murein transglycosylase-like protein
MKYFTWAISILSVVTVLLLSHKSKSAPEPLSTRTLLETHYKVTWPESALLAVAVDEAVAKHGGSVAVVLAQINTETHFRPRKSSEGAMGYMQVMPVWNNSKECPYNIYEKYENVLAGVCVLSHYQQKYGNLEDALVAYNIGPNSTKGYSKGVQYRNKVLKEAEKVK